MTGFEISTTPGHGRSLKATTSFPPGTHIDRFPNPLLALPATPVLSTTCSACLRTDRPIHLCTGCRVLGYCSTECQRTGWKAAPGGGAGHKKECPVLKTALARGNGEGMPTPTRALLAVMLAGKAAEDKIKGLEGNLEGFKKEVKAWEDIRLQAYAALAYTRVARPDKTEYYAEIMCKILTNAFNAYDPDLGQSAVFLDPILAMANHSCLPNANVQIHGREAVLIAERDISAGDEILISYIDPSNSLMRRREDLRQYHFTCTCSRCTEDLDLYTVTSKLPDSILNLNAFSLTTPSFLRNPPIDPITQFALKSIQAPIQLQYTSLSTPPEGITRAYLASEYTLVKPLIAANLWAASPVPWFLNDCLGYWCDPSHQDFVAALAVMCLSASRVAPVTHPLPWSSYRLKNALGLCRALPNAIVSPAAFKERISALCTQVKLDKKQQQALESIDAVAMCRMVLTMMETYKDKAHLEAWSVAVEASEMLGQIRSLPEMEGAEYGATLELWEKNTDRSGPWLEFWKSMVVEIVEALAEIGARLIVQEFDIKKDRSGIYIC